MRVVSLVALFIILSKVTFAQQGVYGKLITIQNKAVSLTEVRLHNTDTIPQQAVLTNVDGLFGFDVAMPTIYHLQVKYNDSQSVFIYNITVDSNKASNVELVVNNATKPNKNFMGKRPLLTAKQIDRMPTTDATEMLSKSSSFANAKTGQAMRSMSSPGKPGVTYIVDGMVIPPNSPVIFTPGSLESIDVIK